MPKPSRTFELQIEQSYEGYAGAQVACLFPLPILQINGRYIKKSPFDGAGYALSDGTFIGVEVKLSKRKASLAIIGPDRKGAGVQWHQLEALADLSYAHGQAYIVWNNGGEVGVIGNSLIQTAYLDAKAAFISDPDGASAGDKSISWDRFKSIEPTAFGGVISYDWMQRFT